MKIVVPPQNTVADCKVLMDRTRILDYMPKNAVVAEVGTREGHFSRLILDKTNPTELHLLDLNWTRFEREKFLNEIELKRVILHNRDSARGIRTFPVWHFDWIYIDASHDYASVRRDIDAAVGRVKPGGYLIFNDYIGFTRRGDEYGVVRAVNELLCAGGWKMRYLALQKGGYHDVVLQQQVAGLTHLKGSLGSDGCCNDECLQ